MEKFVKKTGRGLWLAVKTALTCYRVLKNAKYQPIERVPEGRTLLVCGNGPSLGDQIDKYPEIFQSHDVLCVNAMCTTEWFRKVKPKYYCIMDPTAMYDPVTVTPYIRERVETIWDGLVGIDWDMEFIVPRYFAKSATFQSRISKAGLRVRYINLIGFEGFSAIRDWALKRQLCSIGGQTVVTAAVFYGICKGYATIYLLGAELNWLKSLVVDDENMLYIDDSHFYGTEMRRPMVNEFGKKITISNYLAADGRAFREYEQLEEYSKRVGTKIYNATPNSLVDAFERRQLEMLLEGL